jgi:hypothetical protein
MTDDQFWRGVAVAMVPGLKMLLSSLFQRWRGQLATTGRNAE